MTDLTFYTYIITNHKFGALYTGHTENIYKRMEQHIHGEYKGFSKKYGLKHLVWFQELGSRHEAFTKERQIKNWSRQWKLNLINRENPHWLDIHKLKYWPLPDPEDFPNQYHECLKHCVDPALRQDERHWV